MRIDNSYKGSSDKSGVYFIKNIVDGKYYIGSTKSKFHSRKTRHKTSLEKGTHSNQHLQNAWNKYGGDNFVFGILLVTKINVEFWETYYIYYYGSLDRKRGYNKVLPNNYKSGYNLTESQIGKMSELKKIKSKTLSGHDSDERGLCKEYIIYDCNKNLVKKCKSNKEVAEYFKTTESYTSTILSDFQVWFFKNHIVTVPWVNIDQVPEFSDGKVRVDVYDVFGNLIWENVKTKDVAEYIECKQSEVRMCYTGRRSHVQGYVITRHKVKPPKLNKLPLNYISIIQKRKDGQIERIWNNLKEIENNTDFSRKSIVRVLRKERKTYKNFIWQLEDTIKQN